MVNAVDPKCKPWPVAREELDSIANEACNSERNDQSLCLTHGFHHLVTYEFRDPIRCIAYKGSSGREEFLTNHGTGPGNVFNLRAFSKTSQVDRPRKGIVPIPSTFHQTEKSVPVYMGGYVPQPSLDGQTNKENYTHRFPVHGPPLQHVVWIPKHRLFAAIGNDNNLRVFADTLNRCQVVSAPTLCPMPVLCMVYLEETDEVVTGSIGVIKPWKIRLSTNLASSQSEERKPWASQPKTNNEFGHGRQMLQVTQPVVKDRRLGYKRMAIDYLRRQQVWSIRLHGIHDRIGSGDKKSWKFNVHQQNTSIANSQGVNHIAHGHVSLTRCDFFPRFGYFITGGGEGSIRIMHMVNFGLVTTLRGHRGAITGLVAHSRHPILCSSSTDGSIRVWCLETFKMTQRIDTGQSIECMSISSDCNYLFYYSKLNISIYRLTNVYTLFSVLHSTASKLIRFEGNLELGIPGKILAALEDGSVAFLSPVTGLLLTMIYPMTTLQVYKETVFDAVNNLAYLKLYDGEMMQCDCRTNPCLPTKRFFPHIPFDQDVTSIASVWIRLENRRPISAIFAGLRSGQIALVHPNSLHMEIVQAHSGHVRFLKAVARNPHTKSIEGDALMRSRWCTEKLISIGTNTARTWNLKLLPVKAEADIRDMLQCEVFLEPDVKVNFPFHLLNPEFVTALSDRLCFTTSDNHIWVLLLKTFTEHELLACTKQSQLELPSSSNTDTIGTRKLTLETFNLPIVRTHHQDDDHAGIVTAVESSQKLSCFVSASEDGYVKLWDEENRLLREICFLPHPVTAVCFANDRDLLVALGGRICLVETTTFMTINFIKERNVTSINFEDDILEAALPYNDNVECTLSLCDIPAVPLKADERSQSPDIEAVRSPCSSKSNANTSEQDNSNSSSRENLIGLKNYDLILNFPGRSASSLAPRRFPSSARSFSAEKSIASLTKKTTLVDKTTNKAQLQWVKLGRKLIRRAKVEGVAPKMVKEVAKGTDNSYSQSTKDSEVVHIDKLQENEWILPDGAACHVSRPMDTMGFSQIEIDRILESKYPVAPDCYIPNSVIRLRVRPPPPEVEEVKEWKLKPVPSPLLISSKSSNQSVLILDFDSSDSSLNLLDFSSSSQFSLLNAPNDSLFPEKSALEVSVLSSFGGKAVNTSSINEVNFLNEIDEQKDFLSLTDPRNVEIKKDVDSRCMDESVATQAVESNISSSTTDEDDDLRPMKNNHKKTTLAPERLNMKAKLMEKRAAAIEKAQDVKVLISPILKDIVEAPWFRKKLEKITPDTVVDALIEMGDTTRLFAHDKACNSLLLIDQHFAEKEGGGEDKLSPVGKRKIQQFLAKFIKPSYDANNPFQKHQNRVALAHKALDTLICGVEMNEAIQKELFRLLIDSDESLRERARLILEEKLGIDTWKKLCGQLNNLTGESIVKSSEELVEEQKEVMKNLSDRFSKGETTLVDKPMLSYRFGLETASSKRKESLPKRKSSILLQISGSKVFGKSNESLPARKSIIPNRSDSVKPAPTRLNEERRTRKFSKIRDQSPTSPEYEPVDQQAGFDAFRKIILPKKKINWKRSVPKKSQERRRMSHLIAMTSASALVKGSYINITKKFDNGNELSFQENAFSESADSVRSYTYLPPIVSVEAPTSSILDATEDGEISLRNKVKLPDINAKENKKVTVEPKKRDIQATINRARAQSMQPKREHHQTTLKDRLPSKDGPSNVDLELDATKVHFQSTEMITDNNKNGRDFIKTSTMSVNDDSNIDSVAASNRNSDNKLSTKLRFGTGEVDTHTTKGRTISKSMFSADPAERLEKFSAIVISDTLLGSLSPDEAPNKKRVPSKKTLKKVKSKSKHTGILPLPKMCDIQDSGFAENMKTEDTDIKIPESDNWREMLAKLKKNGQKDLRSQGNVLYPRISSHYDKQRDMLMRLLAHSMLAPGERLASQYQYDRPVKIEKRRRAIALPGKLSTQICSEGEGDSRYGIMSIRWTDNQKQKSLLRKNKNPNILSKLPASVRNAVNPCNSGFRMSCGSYVAATENHCCLATSNLHHKEEWDEKETWSCIHEDKSIQVEEMITKGREAAKANVARSKALLKILNAALAREREERKRIQEQSHETGAKEAEFIKRKKAEELKLPMCEKNVAALKNIMLPLKSNAS
ncbi:unnamed protein product [Clavelina lepadiformis]|uniref:Uncharacterized protein n=1 Tax=Clavelina lepadiformis TaxID=159417 RepID=A0ABP0FLK7_CLALP